MRVSLEPDANGGVSYGKLFSVMPFGNGVVTKTLTGTEIKALLEQQFQAASYAPGARPALLVPSASLTYVYDLRRPVGSRLVSIRLDGRRIQPERRYRVATNNYLAAGGDGYTVLAAGRDPVEAGVDIDVMAAWLAKGQRVPAVGRTREIG